MSDRTKRMRALAGYLLEDVAGVLLDIGFVARRAWMLKRRAVPRRRHRGR